jgi:LuxR family maltose regulon positive regulatory protein
VSEPGPGQGEPTVVALDESLLNTKLQAHLLTGDIGQAGALFAETSAVGATLGNTDTIVDSEAELAVLAMDGGRWAEAAEHLERALTIIDEHRMHDYAASALPFAAAARLAVHRGDLQEAHRQLTQAMRARPACTYVMHVCAAIGCGCSG